MTKTSCCIGIAIALVALCLLFAAPLQASDAQLRMNIPFRFLAGDTVMPPGMYFVTLSETSRSITLMGWEKAVRVPVSAAGIRRPHDRTDKGTLLFDKFGATYVLRSAWNANRVEGCAIYRTRKLDRDMAALPKTEVVIAAE